MATPAVKLNLLNSSGSSIFVVNESIGVTSNLPFIFTNTSVSLNASSGSVIINGGIAISNPLNSSSVTNGGALTISGGAAIGNDLYVNNNIYTNRISTSSLASNGITIGNIYSDLISSSNIAVSGNVTIGGNLIVLGTTTIVNVTSSNTIDLNITTSSILVTSGPLNATFNNNTIANIFTTGGNVGINTTSPNFTLDITSGTLNASSATISNINVNGLTGNSISITNYSGNNIQLSGSITSQNLITSSILVSTGNVNISSGNLNVSGNISSGSQISADSFTGATLQINNGSITNLISTNASIGGVSYFGPSNANIVITGGNMFIGSTTTNYQTYIDIATCFSGGSYRIGSMYGGGIGNGLEFVSIVGTSSTVFPRFNFVGQNATSCNICVFRTGGSFTAVNTEFLQMGWNLVDNAFSIKSMRGTTSQTLQPLLISTGTNGSMIFLSTSGNIGIYTTSPSVVFDVNGTCRISGNATVNSLLISNGNLTISTGSLNVSGNISSGSQISGDSFTGAILQISGQGSIASLISTNISGTNLLITNATINNLLGNLSSANSIFTNITTTNLLNVNASITNLTGTLISATNLLMTSASIGTVSGLSINTTNAIHTNMSASFLVNSFSTMAGLSVANGSSQLFIQSLSGSSTVHQRLNFLTHESSRAGGTFWIDSTNASRSSYFGKAYNAGSALFHLVYQNTTSGEALGSHTSTTTLFKLMDNGFLGLGLTGESPSVTLHVGGTIASTYITTGALQAGIATIGSALMTDITASTLTTTLVSGTNLLMTNASIANLTGTNLLMTNITSSNIIFVSLVGTHICSTNLTSSNATITNLTGTNLLMTNSSISSLVSTQITNGTLFNISNGSFGDSIGLATNNRALNLVSSNAVMSIWRYTTSGNASPTVEYIWGTNSIANTGGNSYWDSGIALGVQNNYFIRDRTNGINATRFYINNQGNVGINTTNPNYILDVNGITNISNGTFSLNSTTGSLICYSGISITGTNASSSTNGGALTINGGAGISQDVYLGGNFYIQGVNSTVITGNVLIGSQSGTGVYQVAITYSRTLSNTSYKIIGTIATTSNNTNTYIVSFCNLTSAGCTANILRLDAFQSGWTDIALTLDYVIYP
jgi:uncharacterized protein YjbI with pentapeptide repeats